MKKYISIFIAVVMVVVFTLFVVMICAKDEVRINGKILLNIGKKGLNVYDCSKETFEAVKKHNGAFAVFSGDDAVLIGNGGNIVEYNLNTKEERTVYEGKPDYHFSIDFLTVCKKNVISFSIDNYIILYNEETKKEVVVANDNGSEKHSWSKDSEVLYYSDKNGKIKAVNTSSGEIKEIAVGREPIVSGSNIAYKNKGKLIVENIKTNKKYTYRGSAYNYCFSPTGNELLIEDEMSLLTAIKNIFSRDIVLGHSLVAWDYKNNKKSTVIDACSDTWNLICDWKTD